MAIAAGQIALASDFWTASLQAAKTNTGNFAEETILSGTLPAGALTTGRLVKVTAFFSDGFRSGSGSDDGCKFRLKLGGVTVVTLDTSNQLFGAVSQLSGILRYNGSNLQAAVLHIDSFVAGSNIIRHGQASGTTNQNASNALAITLTVQSNTLVSGGKYACAYCVFELI